MREWVGRHWETPRPRTQPERRPAPAPPPKPRTVSVVWRYGGAAIGMLVTERARELPAAGASLWERWDAIAPGTMRPAHRPESAAWATKLRLEQTRVVQVANESAGRTVVRRLRILAPGSVPAPAPDDDAPQTAPVSEGPVRTGGVASDGYQRALAAHRQAVSPRLVDPAIAEAVERQSHAMRELSRRAFPSPGG
ncbi:DUF721 domain-containing protein [Streptomyces sp. ISL-22]|nr:DUF721 domain-containing protein [Streptomyces sp. ISL-24]MBT2437685.1 DUF721 domain-containing protein [Streptomyces sp. ISL-22]